MRTEVITILFSIQFLFQNPLKITNEHTNIGTIQQCTTKLHVQLYRMLKRATTFFQVKIIDIELVITDHSQIIKIIFWIFSL